MVPELVFHYYGSNPVIVSRNAKLKGYDACFFCAGVSSVGMKEEEYRRITYDTTLNFARALALKPQMSETGCRGNDLRFSTWL